MELKHIDNCTEYFNFGQLDSSIIADVFLWDDDEDINLLPVLEFIKRRNEKKYTYIITSRSCIYPVGTIDKYLKLWRRICKDYNLQPIRKFEKQEDLKCFSVYFGIAEISREYLEVTMEILLKNYMYSCIVLSDKKLDLEKELDRNLDVSREKTYYNLNFLKLINSVCDQDEVIISILGCNGSSMNYFHLS